MSAAQLAMCEGKAVFPSWDIASRAAKRHRGLCVYRCRYCGSWHVGTERTV